VKEKIGELPSVLQNTDIMAAREWLGQFIEKIEISSNKEARVYARAFFVLACMELAGVPTALLTGSEQRREPVGIPSRI
jgi:hypothetical protein